MERIFVLGLGRCGTESIVNAMNTLPGVIAMHEPDPDLLDLAEQRLFQFLNKKPNVTVEDPIAYLHEKRGFVIDKAEFYLESASWNSWLIGDIIKAWPNARFIWITRSHFSWAQSAYRRGWYDPEIEKDRKRMVRLRPDLFPDDQDRWFKLGHLWSICDAAISRGLIQSKAYYIRINVRDLSSVKTLNNIVRWCRFPGEVTEGKHSNKGNLYVTSQELLESNLVKDTSQIPPNKLFDVEQLIKENIVGEEIREHVDQCVQKAKSLTQEQIDSLTRGMLYRYRGC